MADGHQSIRRGPLRYRENPVAIEISMPDLPADVRELLCLIAVLKRLDLPTDVETLTDHTRETNMGFQEAKSEILRKLYLTAHLVDRGKGLPSLTRSPDGNWEHNIPIETIADGFTEEIEKYKWYETLPERIKKKISSRID